MTTILRKVSAQANVPSILEKAYHHLIQVDERMRPLLNQYPCLVFEMSTVGQKSTEPFEGLVNSILSQQISGAVAKAIKKKFLSIFKDSALNQTFPQPIQVAACSLESLRAVGLSRRKAEYIHGLSEQFVTGALSNQLLYEASDTELFERLLPVRGLGRWSIEMFALFTLKRLDIFSVDDLGVQRGMAIFLGKDVKKLRFNQGKWKYLSKNEMLAFSRKFSPYRSVLMWLMWNITGTDTQNFR